MPDIEELQAKLDAAVDAHRSAGFAEIADATSALVNIGEEIDTAGYDLSPCRCGALVVCIPDGLPLCRECAEKEQSQQ
jgi:hypothetical protein